MYWLALENYLLGSYTCSSANREHESVLGGMKSVPVTCKCDIDDHLEDIKRH